jgi:hypothetical protein
MNYNVLSLDPFEKHYKRLSKKYKSLPEDLLPIIESLEKEPFQGTALGRDCYKIRLAISDKNKGKSGGGRLITCVKVVANTVFLLALIDKGEKDNITDKELDQLLKEAGLL